MSWLEFISATIGQLAWPVLVVVVVLVLKDPIKTLAGSPGLRRVKAGPGGIELEIDRTLDEAKREIEESQDEHPRPIPSAEEQQVAADFTEEMRRLAAVQPRAAVMESYTRLENVVRAAVIIPESLASRRAIPSMRTLARLAVDQRLLPESEAAVLDELTTVRNAVAHSSDEVITYQRAIEYAELVRQLAISFRLAGGGTVLDGPIL